MAEPAVRYYYDYDKFVAALDNGRNGYFVRRGKDAASGDWRFVIPGSIEADNYDQDIHLTHHDLETCPSSISDGLPPLPEPPPFKSMEWKDNFEPVKPLPVKDYPRIRRRVESSPEGECRFWFILAEDRYETLLGDGKYYFFEGSVFVSEANARAYAEGSNRETAGQDHDDDTLGLYLSVKDFTVSLDGERLKLRGHEPGWHEDYRIEEVVRRVEWFA